MIILITYLEKNELTQREELLVSHGVDSATLENILIPNVPPHQIGYFSESMGEWILDEEK